jgi:hypothetical protein
VVGVRHVSRLIVLGGPAASPHGSTNHDATPYVLTLDAGRLHYRTCLQTDATPSQTAVPVPAQSTVCPQTGTRGPVRVPPDAPAGTYRVTKDVGVAPRLTTRATFEVLGPGSSIAMPTAPTP